MDYSANSLKNQYEKDCLKCRTENLVRLREKVAGMTQTQFSEKIGIQKTNLNSLEKGSRDMSLFNIQAYKTFFRKNYGIDVSVDYLLGYTSVMENRSMNISNELGLTGESIEMLKLMNDKKNNLYKENKKNLLMLNFILSSFYDEPERSSTHLYFTILRKMWEYITMNPKDIGYYALNENGEYIVKKKLHLVNEEHIKKEDTGISPQIALGDLYKYQLERELIDGIKELEEMLKKKESEK